MIEYFDQWNMIVQRNRDGGDSCQRMGMYAFGYYLNICFNYDFDYRNWPNGSFVAYHKALEKLECPNLPNEYRRHPDPTEWYSDSNRLSRDQLIPLIVGMSTTIAKERLGGLFKNHLHKRFLLFATNNKPNDVPSSDPAWKMPDITFFSVWALYIRSFHDCKNKYMKFLQPLLWIFDLEILINSTIITIKGHFNTEDTSDDLNHIITLLYALIVLPTPTAKLAKFIYKFRPKTLPPACGYQSDFGPQTALDYYFREENGGSPMNELYRPILEKLLR